MADREKVLKGLECCQKTHCDKCPYVYDGLCNTNDCTADLASDALELLEEQEAVKPKLVGPSMWRCGKCDELLGWEDFTPSGVELVEYKFCPKCGRPVKWE